MKIKNKVKEFGVIYTPDWIVKLILNHVGYSKKNVGKKILDPACGEGAFLSQIVEVIIKRYKKDSNLQNLTNSLSNIYGFDIDKQALSVCRKKLTKLCKDNNIVHNKWNLVNIDSLVKENILKYYKNFDLIVGNPPYVRIQNLETEKREYIQNTWSLCNSGSTDIYIAFFEICFNLLKKDGVLGFITPNTYLKTKAGEKLRNKIRYELKIKELIDFNHHQLFENATTYSLITILNKKKPVDYFRLYKGDIKRINYIDKVKISNLKNDNWILESNNILKKINKIENLGIPLGKIANIHVGITTLADSYYIFKDVEFNGEYAKIKLKSGKEYIIERVLLKPIIKASILKSSNDIQNRFIIFPYYKSEIGHKIIEEKDLMKKYPKTYCYFKEIKSKLILRDKGKPNPVAWYAFGRSQGLDTSFGEKILTSPLNLKPKFIFWEKPEYTFYSGYCIKFDGTYKWLLEKLNSDDMEFFIKYTSRDYQSNYKSYAKSFIEKFGITDYQQQNDIQESLF